METLSHKNIIIRPIGQNPLLSSQNAQCLTCPKPSSAQKLSSPGAKLILGWEELPAIPCGNHTGLVLMFNASKFLEQ